MPDVVLLDDRLARIEAAVFGHGYAPNIEGLPSANYMPSDLEASTTTGPDGTLVTISWGNWSPVVQQYEIWGTGPDGKQNLQKTTNYGPVFFTMSVDAVEGWTFTVRPIVEGSTPAIEFCPSIAVSISPPSVGSADIANGAVQDQHFDRVSANQIVIVGADIANATITQANMGNASIGTAQIIALAVTDALIANATITSAKIASVTAASILAGTIVGVNVSAGTYSLTVGNEQMTINGTTGFRQVNSSTGSYVEIVGGEIDAGVSATPTWDITNDISGSIEAAKIRFFRNGNRRAELGSDESANNEGYLELLGSSGTVRAKLSCDGSSNRGRLQLDASNTEVLIRANSSGAAGDNITIYNSSGTIRARMGVSGGGSDSQIILDTSSTPQVALIADNAAGSLHGLSIDGNRVVGPQGAAVTKPSGGTTIDTQARTAIDALIDRLGASLGHGLIA